MRATWSASPGAGTAVATYVTSPPHDPGDPLGDERLTRARSAQDEGDHGSSRRTAACVQRAMRSPHGERGPANRSGAAADGQTTTTASVAVPVPSTLASISACALASVAVITAFTAAPPVRAGGTWMTRLIVPGGSESTVPGRRVPPPHSGVGAGRFEFWLVASALPGTAAPADVGWLTPTVAWTVTPSTVLRRSTSAAVNNATPCPRRSRPLPPPGVLGEIGPPVPGIHPDVYHPIGPAQPSPDRGGRQRGLPLASATPARREAPRPSPAGAARPSPRQLP